MYITVYSWAANSNKMLSTGPFWNVSAANSADPDQTAPKGAV